MSEGLLCRCSVCGREERAGASPLRNGWPSCHGYTMTLVETQRFIDGIEQAMGEVFAPVRAVVERKEQP
jgi:hypothetical protein